jgi:hypothetical protein
VGNVGYHSDQNPLFSHLLSNNIKNKIFKIIILPVVFCSFEIWSLALKEGRI